MLHCFDKVFIINLPERVDRRREVGLQLARIGRKFDERIRLFEAVRPVDGGGFRSRGVHGCFMSHLGALRQAVQEGAESVLLLEDDVDFVPEFSRLSGPIADRLSAGQWDMFYGGYDILAPGVLGDAPFESEGVRMAPQELPILLGHFVGFRGLSIGHVVNHLEQMLTRPPGHPLGGPMDVDGAYNWYRKGRSLKVLLADPQLGYQRASPSSIAVPRWFDRVPGLTQFAALLRRRRNARNSRA